MADLVTLETLIQLFRDVTGVPGDAYWRDDRISRALQQGVKIFWRELGDGDGAWGRARTTVVATPETGSITVPDAVRQLLQLERPCSGTAADYSAADRVQVYSDPGTDSQPELALPGVYLFEGTALLLRPVPVVAEVIRLYYESTAPVLALLTDAIDCVEGYEQAIILHAAAFAITDPARQQVFQARARDATNEIRNRRAQRDRGGLDYVRNYRQRVRTWAYPRRA